MHSLQVVRPYSSSISPSSLLRELSLSLPLLRNVSALAQRSSIHLIGQIGQMAKNYLKLEVELDMGVMEMAENDKLSHRRRHSYWGVILVLIGVFALLVNLKIIPSLNWDVFWPLLLIVIGILMLYGQSRE
jgi:hypothetical protein